MMLEAGKTQTPIPYVCYVGLLTLYDHSLN
jgi:hypothetical protein